VCPSFGLAAPLAVATVRVLLAVPVRSGFGLRRSPFPLTGPLFAGLTEPVLSGRWCLPEGLFPTGVPPVWGMWRQVSSCVLKVYRFHWFHPTASPSGDMSAMEPAVGARVGASRHIQLSVVCAWLAAVYIHAPGVPAGCMPPAPGYCHEGLGGTAPAFGESAAVMGMPTAPNDEEGV